MEHKKYSRKERNFMSVSYAWLMIIPLLILDIFLEIYYHIIGLVHYALIIAGKIKKYWWGIKHKKDDKFVEPAHHKNFLNYGDEKEYKQISKRRKK